jgi:hypothetical protein
MVYPTELALMLPAKPMYDKLGEQVGWVWMAHRKVFAFLHII